MNILDPDKLRWQDISNYVPHKNGGAVRPEGFAAKFAAALDDEGLDLLVEVKDARHFQNFNDQKLWEGDSVQIALDTAGKGSNENSLELTAALGSGGPVLWKQKAADFDGLILARCTQQGNPVKYASIKIDRINDGLLYEIHIEKDELYPFKAEKGRPLRFSILVNDNNGSGREGWLEWGSGIGRLKAPALFGNLTRRRGRAKAA